MFYVYLIKSINTNKTYIGFTQDLKHRLKEHNSGESPHTTKYKPWKLEMYFAFSEKSKAIALEKYLKSGSGRALAQKHFW